jgi:hypothetical protein
MLVNAFREAKRETAKMDSWSDLRKFTLAAAALFLSLVIIGTPAHAQAAPAPAPNQESPALRDGQHDFDFNMGVWRTQIKRVVDPFSPSSPAMDLSGTVSVRPVWGGRAKLEEIEVDGPKGHWEALSLFLYNPQTHQWSQNYINRKIGTIGAALIGEFKDGRAELFQQDTFKDRSIMVRGAWDSITPNSHTYEESYSADGGKTWALAFFATKTREKETAATAAPAPAVDAAPKDSSGLRDGQHDFDFDFGHWKTHSRRLLHPLTGSTTWVEMDGETTVSKVWDGRANLAEYKADGTGGHIELLSLRWYNPTAHQWYLDFATPNVGTLGIPNVGEFKNGRGDFYDQEPFNGRMILVRFSIWGITADTAQSEQAFSDDGGKTWEVNWINQYVRVKDESATTK